MFYSTITTPLSLIEYPFDVKMMLLSLNPFRYYNKAVLINPFLYMIKCLAYFNAIDKMTR